MGFSKKRTIGWLGLAAIGLGGANLSIYTIVGIAINRAGTIAYISNDGNDSFTLTF